MDPLNLRGEVPKTKVCSKQDPEIQFRGIQKSFVNVGFSWIFYTYS